MHRCDIPATGVSLRSGWDVAAGGAGRADGGGAVVFGEDVVLGGCAGVGDADDGGRELAVASVGDAAVVIADVLLDADIGCEADEEDGFPVFGVDVEEQGLAGLEEFGDSVFGVGGAIGHGFGNVSELGFIVDDGDVFGWEEADPVGDGGEEGCGLFLGELGPFGAAGCGDVADEAAW